MNRISRIVGRIGVLILPFSVVSCRGKEKAAPAAEAAAAQPGLIGMEELIRFRNDTRQLYNNRKFAELEALAGRIRSDKERTPGGAWKIEQFYDCMDCRDDEPESMWKLHEQIHQEWETRYPQSSTAQIAKAQFYLSYAWHARSDGYADEVTEEGWRLFRERLAQARTLLDQSKSLVPACPVWWLSYQTVALGQGWSHAEYDALFREAVKFEPEFDPYDTARAKYLLPRWHGEPGDWEKAADEEIAPRGEMGHQIYAQVVSSQSGYYDNVFKESTASWRKTRKGYEQLIARFPTSSVLLNNYCRLACLAGDRKLAKELFGRIGGNKVSSAWHQKEFEKAKVWAMSGE